MLCLLTACAEEAKGADLWRGAKVGMSVKDVLALFPDAVAVSADDPQIVTRGEEVERVRIDPYQVGELPFRVSMLFEDGKLAMIKESAKADGDAFDFPGAYRATKRVLGKTYGRPYTEVDIPMFTGTTWYLDKVDLSLAMWKRGDKPYDVVVTYSPAKSDKVPR